MVRRIPRRVALVIWPILLGAVHVALPVGLARRGQRYGWRDRPARPGLANVPGVVPLVAGTALVSWASVEHFAAASDEGWATTPGVEPAYLLTEGPYRLGRNPIHVGGIAIWGGWATWFGSSRVAAGVVVLTGVYRAGIAWEERTLERRWGEQWHEYARRTSRSAPAWIAPHMTSPDAPGQLPRRRAASRVSEPLPVTDMGST